MVYGGMLYFMFMYLLKVYNIIIYKNENISLFYFKVILYLKKFYIRE